LASTIANRPQFFPPAPLQGFGNLFPAGLDPDFAELGQGRSVAIPRQNRPNDLPAGFSGHAGNDLGQLQVHLRQRFLHLLDMASLVTEQHRLLPRHRAQRAKSPCGRNAPVSKPRSSALAEKTASFFSTPAGHGDYFAN
jgi:hypothetical protein